jgi:arginine:pyruvate transaminase
MRYAAITDRLRGLGGEKWAMSHAARARAEAGLPVINLTIGEPDVGTAPELMDAAATAMRAGRTHYSNGRGESSLLQALARRYSDRLGRAFGPDRFLCLPGTQTSLHLALTVVCEPGDEVLVSDPMYATYEALIRAPGAVPVTAALRPDLNFRLQAADLEPLITPRTRAILINTPHNPTGAVLRPADLAAILDLAARHDLWVISDEVYGDLTHDGVPAPSALADPAHEGRVIAVASISKSHAAPGFRSGWLVASAEFCTRALPVSETMLFGSQPFIADMTAQALAGPPVLARAMAARMANRARILESGLAGVPGLHLHRPEAGMFALLDHRAVEPDSLAFARRLLEATEVAVMPGSSFGAALQGWARLALNQSDAATAEAAARIAAFVRARAAA